MMSSWNRAVLRRLICSSALLGPRPLVLDVVAGDTGLDESSNQVAHVRISAVTGVGVGDDERTKIDGRGSSTLFVGHLQP
jgi:hypothetical protein